MSEEAIYLYLAGALAVGFGWGRLSSRLPIPELLRLLGTFFCMGMLGGLVVGLVQLMTRPPRVEAFLMHLDFITLIQATAVYGCSCFLIGAVLGAPSILGFAFGYRRPRRQSILRRS
jgi:hypothetical protein